MSLMSHEKMTCPHCGKTFEFACWSSVNSEISPEQLEKVLDGSIFRLKCPHCGEETVCIYPMLVNIMKPIPCFIRLTDDPEKEIPEAESMFYNNPDPIMKLAAPKRYRFVTSFPELKEKIMLFQQGLDDRTVEIMKQIFRLMLARKGEDAGAIRYSRNSSDGKEYIVVTREEKKPIFFPFTQENYEESEKQNRNLDPHWDENNRSAFIVNSAWAAEWLEKVQKE
jgi:rRNA maturation protein Nop10